MAAPAPAPSGSPPAGSAPAAAAAGAAAGGAAAPARLPATLSSLPSHVVGDIASFLPAAGDALDFAVTCKAFRMHAPRARGIARANYLRAVKAYGFSADDLDKELLASNAFIAGGFALACVNGDDFPGSDMDIYADDTIPIGTFLLRHGYRCARTQIFRQSQYAGVRPAGGAGAGPGGGEDHIRLFQEYTHARLGTMVQVRWPHIFFFADDCLTFPCVRNVVAAGPPCIFLHSVVWKSPTSWIGDALCERACR